MVQQSSETIQDKAFCSGFIALVGRPNSGKSTLVNALIGEKIAITSPVSQTTRKRLRAVINTEHAQLVLVDTPGLHKPKDALGKELNRAALAELADVDVVCMLVDATRPVGTGDAWVARHVDAAHAHKLLIITKADIASAAQVSAQLEAASQLAHFDDALVVSAKEGFNLDSFIALVSTQLPEGPKWYPDDMISDADDEELAAEFVREKVLLHCKQEIPHAVGVLCTQIEERKSDVLYIACTILVERESQKGIVVGAGGSMIKRIGAAARPDLERLFGAKVYLDLKVEVAPLWRRDSNEIRRLGYDAGN